MFDHTNNNFVEAIGISEDRHEEIGDIVMQAMKENDKVSESVEDILNNELTNIETFMAGFICGNVKAKNEFMGQMLGGLLGKIRKDMEITEDNPDIPKFEL